MLNILRPNRDVYYRKRIGKIVNTVVTNTYPPVYEKNKWKGSKTNCYAYALDLNIDDPHEFMFIPGCISSYKSNLHIFGNITEHIKDDLDFLNIAYRDNQEGELNEGEYRIAVYYRPTFHDMPIGFHIARQDKDGRWSEKPSWDADVHIIQNEVTDTPPNLEEHKLYLESVLIISKRK